MVMVSILFAKKCFLKKWIFTDSFEGSFSMNQIEIYEEITSAEVANL